MFPVINVFGKEIGTYTIMALIGSLIAGYYACKNIKEKKLDDNDLIIFLLVCAIGVLLGSHILYGITNFEKLSIIVMHLDRIKNIDDFLFVVTDIFGGSVFYGGLIGGILVGLIYGKIKKRPIRDYADVMAPAIPLFHTFGRIGCFLGGCCYGIKSHIGIYYNNSYYLKDVEVATRFPVQLVESVCNFILFLVLNRLYKKEKFKGSLLLVYLMNYSVIRFILEFFRGDEYRGFLFGLSTSQIVSIGLFIISLILFIKDRKNNNIKEQ